MQTLSSENKLNLFLNFPNMSFKRHLSGLIFALPCCLLVTTANCSLKKQSQPKCGLPKLLQNFQGQVRWSTQPLKSKSFQIKLGPTVCDHNQTGKLASQIVSHAEENIKWYTITWRYDMTNQLGDTLTFVPRPCKKSSGHSRPDAKLWLFLRMKMILIDGDRYGEGAVNGGLEVEVKPYSNFISRMSCLPQD